MANHGDFDLINVFNGSTKRGCGAKLYPNAALVRFISSLSMMGLVRCWRVKE